VDTLRLRTSQQQLRRLLTHTLTVSAVAALLLIMWRLHPHDRFGATLGPWAIGAGLGALVSAYAYAAYAMAFTDCVPSGIRTRGLGGKRECSWASVRDISEVRDGIVRVSTSCGPNFWLGAPVNSRLMQDPEFFSKVMEIRDYWRSATERPAGTLR